MDYDFRPITFEGVQLAPSVMGISVLEPIIDEMNDRTGEWIWRLPICCGVTKSAGARLCYEASTDALNLMLEHRALVLIEIAERFPDAPFSAEQAYEEWATALASIQKVSAGREDTCEWSAPSHSDDPIQTAEDAERFRDGFNVFLDKHERP